MSESLLKFVRQSLNPTRETNVLTRGDFSEDATHCPRCGTNATVGQQFCRSCGLSLEKVAELLGDELAVEPSSSIDERARLRERQQKFEQWGGIAGLLLILLAIGAAVMGLFQTYSKSLKERLANPPLPRASDLPGSDETRKLGGYREPVPTVTDRTTELLVPAKGAETAAEADSVDRGKMYD